MIADPFRNSAPSASSPSDTCFAVVPSDSAELPLATKAIFIGSGGDVRLRPLNGSTDVTFRNLPDGSVLDVRVRAIRASGTTASDIVGLA